MAEVSFEAEPVTDVGRTGVSASPDCLWIAGAVESSRVDAIDALHPFGSHVHGLGDGREIEENSKITELVSRCAPSPSKGGTRVEWSTGDRDPYFEDRRTGRTQLGLGSADCMMPAAAVGSWLAIVQTSHSPRSGSAH